MNKYQIITLVLLTSIAGNSLAMQTRAMQTRKRKLPQQEEAVNTGQKRYRETPTVTEDIDINWRDAAGNSQLHLAALKGNATKVRMLIKDFDFPVNIINENDETPLFLAAQNGQTDIVRMLIEEFHANSNSSTEDNETPLHVAAEEGFTAIVQLLLGAGASADVRTSNGWLPLQLSIVENHVNTVRLLLPVSHTNIDGALPLEEDEEDPAGFTTALHYAAQQGSTDIVKLLIQHHATVDVLNGDHQTPLHLAVRNGFLDVANALLEGHANVDAIDNDRCTALHLAVINDQTEIARLLIMNGHASIDAQDRYGMTPLHYAINKGQLEIAEILIIEGHANVNARDNYGTTPLEMAAYRGDKNMVNLLIRNNANSTDALTEISRDLSSSSDLTAEERVRLYEAQKILQEPEKQRLQDALMSQIAYILGRKNESYKNIRNKIVKGIRKLKIPTMHVSQFAEAVLMIIYDSVKDLDASDKKKLINEMIEFINHEENMKILKALGLQEMPRIPMSLSSSVSEIHQLPAAPMTPSSSSSSSSASSTAMTTGSAQ